LNTPKSPFEQPLDEQLSRSLKQWVDVVAIPRDVREDLLQCAADEACQGENSRTARFTRFLWSLFSFRDTDSMIAPSMPKEMRDSYSRGDEITFGLSVYALQNAVSIGAGLVRAS